MKTIETKLKKAQILTILSILIPAILIPSAVFGQDLGEGYSCSNAQIYKKNKVVALSKAKKAIQDKIDKLGSSAKDKVKKTTLKAVKASLTACTKGTSGGGGSKDVAGAYYGEIQQTSADEAIPSVCSNNSILEVSLNVKVKGNKTSLGPTELNPIPADYAGIITQTGFNLSFTSDSTPGVIRKNVYTATNITAQTAVISFETEATKNGVYACKITYSGTVQRAKGQCEDC